MVLVVVLMVVLVMLVLVVLVLVKLLVMLLLFLSTSFVLVRVVFILQALTWLDLYVYVFVHGCRPVCVIFYVAWYLLV